MGGISLPPLQSVVDDLAKAAPSGAAEAGSVPGSTIAAALDERVTAWGSVSVENDQIIWKHPTGLPPSIVAHLQASVRALNALLRTGAFTLGEDNIIQPRVEA